MPDPPPDGTAAEPGNAGRDATPAGDPEVAREERVVKLKELDVRRREADSALALRDSPWWRRADPLVLAVIGAIVGGILTMIGNMAVAVYNNEATLSQEDKKSSNALKQAEKKANDDLALEKQKAKYTLILQAIATNDPDIAERNINFFISAELLDDPENKIREAIAAYKPVLPAAGGANVNTLAVPEIARLYNFPTELDGTGQVIGVLEFGGSLRSEDIDAYFAGTGLHRPDVTAVSIKGGPKDKGPLAAQQATLDIEITGALAPKARIRAYFAEFSADGFVAAINQAKKDGVTVLLSGWGLSESEWKGNDIRLINDALRAAANSGITIVVAAGDDGVTNGLSDNKPHVDFPASSPWVLAVGGTSLVTRNNQIESEKAWKDGNGLRSDGGGSTGGGVSERFDRPDWQSTAGVPARPNGQLGRGVPDIAAVAGYSFFKLVLAGAPTAGGGTSASAALWAGLIARLNQGLGHNLGFLNPRLYGEIGPAGVLRPVLQGDNGTPGVPGFTAGPGWNAVAGWGTPDGQKLLSWLRTHPAN